MYVSRSRSTSILPKGSSFFSVRSKLENNGLKLHQVNEGKMYIVAMGFEKQVDTTRVGIFFEAEGDNKTRITLSSLSKNALSKAEKIVFDDL